METLVKDRTVWRNLLAALTAVRRTGSKRALQLQSTCVTKQIKHVWSDNTQDIRVNPRKQLHTQLLLGSDKRERERAIETETDRQRQAGRHIQTQRHRQTETKTDRDTDRNGERETDETVAAYQRTARAAVEIINRRKN